MSDFICRSLIYFVLILMNGMKEWSSFIFFFFLHIASCPVFPRTICWRDCLSNHCELLQQKFKYMYTILSVQFSRSVMSDSLQPHGMQHARPPCPTPAPGVYPNSCPLSRWCHPTISSSVIPFSSCPQSFPASGSFQMSQPFISGGQSIGVSASTAVLTMKTQDWTPLGWTGWICLQSKGLSRVFSITTVLKHQFFGTRLS